MSSQGVWIPDPAIAALLTPAAFENSEFSVEQLISDLTEPLIKESLENNSRPKTFWGREADVEEATAFDPKPFIRTLEAAVDHLIPLRKQVSDQANALEDKVAAAERSYSAKVKELGENFKSVSTSFGALETRISEVGRNAVRIGEQLESIDRQRERASEAHDIITYYNEFSKGDVTRLEQLRKEGREGRAKVAVIARRLAAIAGEIDDVEGAEKTKDTIDKYCEQFEKDMLKLFDRYYRKGDPRAMEHCAKVLLDFNGGNSCVQMYVNQHDFFISRARLQDASAITSTPVWEGLPDPDSVAPKSEPGLAKLYESIRTTGHQEAQIIQAVFPNPPVVMQVFLQRVFAQVVQSYIESLMETAATASDLAFLRLLHLARVNTASLIEDLKSQDFFRAATTAISPIDSLNASTHTTAGPVVGVGAISIMLDHSLEEIFVPYMEGARYLDKEIKSLTELFASCLLKFNNWHRARSKNKSSNTIFDRVVNQLGNAATTSGSTQASSTQSGGGGVGLKTLMKLGGYGTTADDKPAELVIEDKDGEINLETTERMLKWHAEAVGRMIDLSPVLDAPRNAFALLKVLADSIGREYIETALDTALTQITSYIDGKTEPDLKPIAVVKNADLGVQLWQRYISTVLLPLAGTSVTVRREMVLFHNHIVMRIEGKANSLIQRSIEACGVWFANVLKRQQRLDFKPKSDTGLFERERTEPCAACCSFLGKTRDIANTALSGKNREIFLTEVGVTFHSLLLDHFKKFPVSDTGTIPLTKDLAAYQDVASTFGLPAVTERFEMLRQLGKLFEVQVDILKGFMAGDSLGKIDARLLRPYLIQRADYDKYPRKFWDSLIGATEIIGQEKTSLASLMRDLRADLADLRAA